MTSTVATQVGVGTDRVTENPRAALVVPTHVPQSEASSVDGSLSCGTSSADPRISGCSPSPSPDPRRDLCRHRLTHLDKPFHIRASRPGPAHPDGPLLGGRQPPDRSTLRSLSPWERVGVRGAYERWSVALTRASRDLSQRERWWILREADNWRPPSNGPSRCAGPGRVSINPGQQARRLATTKILVQRRPNSGLRQLKNFLRAVQIEWLREDKLLARCPSGLWPR